MLDISGCSSAANGARFSGFSRARIKWHLYLAVAPLMHQFDPQNRTGSQAWRTRWSSGTWENNNPVCPQELQQMDGKWCSALRNAQFLCFLSHFMCRLKKAGAQHGWVKGQEVMHCVQRSVFPESIQPRMVELQVKFWAGPPMQSINLIEKTKFNPRAKLRSGVQLYQNPISSLKICLVHLCDWLSKQSLNEFPPSNLFFLPSIIKQFRPFE